MWTHFRLLRFALARRLGRDVTLPDPYGTELRTGRDADGELVYSVGKDGVDGGGDPRQDLVRRLR